MKTLHAEVCTIFLEDKDINPGILSCVAGSGYSKRIVGIAQYPFGLGFTGTVANGREFNIKSKQELESLKLDGKRVWLGQYDEMLYNGKSEFRNLIALPLKTKKRIIGVIRVENKIKEFGDFFTNEDVIILKTICNIISLGA